MLSRRSMFASLVGLVATLPFAGRAFGAVKSSGRWEEWVGLPTDAMPVAPHIYLKTDGMIQVLIKDEPVWVHRIEMEVHDEGDKNALAVLFEIPVDRPIIVSSGDLSTPGGNLPGKTGKRHRVILPLFEYDAERKVIIGEEPEVTTLEDRLSQILDATKQHGFDMVSGFEGGHIIWLTQTGPGWEHPRHAMGCLPYEVTTDDMHLIAPMRMLRRYRQV
jgi:hypothetical protein